MSNFTLNNFNNNSKTILFVEPYGATIALLKRGLELGYNIIVLSANKDFRVVPSDVRASVSAYFEVDTINYAEVTHLVKELSHSLNIHAVIPGFEYFVPIAAKLSQMLHVPGLNPDTVMNLRRKDYMRVAMEREGLLTPKFILVSSMVEIDQAVEKIGFPAICKPVDAAGSVHVRKVDNKNELMEAANIILTGNDILWGHQLSNLLLVEEYVDGKEYSIEGVVQNNVPTYFSITEKFVSDQTEFIEIGHIVNTPFDKSLTYTIHDYIGKVIRVLGVNNCAFHGEFRLNSDGKPVLMEMAARLAGDRIGDLISLARGINYFDCVYAAYLGDPLPAIKMENHFAGIRFFYRPEVDKYRSVRGVDDVSKMGPVEDCSIYYNPDTAIPSFPKPLRRLGHVIIKGDSYQMLSEMLNTADKTIFFDTVA